MTLQFGHVHGAKCSLNGKFQQLELEHKSATRNVMSALHFEQQRPGALNIFEKEADAWIEPALRICPQGRRGGGGVSPPPPPPRLIQHLKFAGVTGN